MGNDEIMTEENAKFEVFKANLKCSLDQSHTPESKNFEYIKQLSQFLNNHYDDIGKEPLKWTKFILEFILTEKEIVLEIIKEPKLKSFLFSILLTAFGRMFIEQDARLKSEDNQDGYKDLDQYSKLKFSSYTLYQEIKDSYTYENKLFNFFLKLIQQLILELPKVMIPPIMYNFIFNLTDLENVKKVIYNIDLPELNRIFDPSLTWLVLKEDKSIIQQHAYIIFDLLLYNYANTASIFNQDRNKLDEQSWRKNILLALYCIVMQFKIPLNDILLYAQNIDIPLLVETLCFDFQSMYSLFFDGVQVLVLPFMSKIDWIFKNMILAQIEPPIKLGNLLELAVIIDAAFQYNNSEMWYNWLLGLHAIILHTIKEILSLQTRIDVEASNIDKYLTWMGWDPNKNVTNSPQSLELRNDISKLIESIVKVLNEEADFNIQRLSCLFKLVKEMFLNSTNLGDNINHVYHFLTKLELKISPEFIYSNPIKEVLLNVPSIYFLHKVIKLVMDEHTFDRTMITTLFEKLSNEPIQLNVIINLFVLKVTGLFSFSQLPELHFNMSDLNFDSQHQHGDYIYLFLMQSIIKYLEFNNENGKDVSDEILFCISDVSIHGLLKGMKMRCEITNGDNLLHQALINDAKQILTQVYKQYQYQHTLTLFYNFTVQITPPKSGFKRAMKQDLVASRNKKEASLPFIKQAKLHSSNLLINRIDTLPFNTQKGLIVKKTSPLFFINILEAFESKNEKLIEAVKLNLDDYTDLITNCLCEQDYYHIYFLVLKSLDHTKESLSAPYFARFLQLTDRSKQDEKADMSEMYILDTFRQSPILFEYLRIVAYDTKLFKLLSGIWKRLLYKLTQFWITPCRSTPKNHSYEYFATDKLLTCLVITNVLPKQVAYLNKILHFIDADELGDLLKCICYGLDDNLKSKDQLIFKIREVLKLHPQDSYKVVKLFF